MGSVVGRLFAGSAESKGLQNVSHLEGSGLTTKRGISDHLQDGANLMSVIPGADQFKGFYSYLTGDNFKDGITPEQIKKIKTGA